jgi:hypothetical protein
MEIKTAFPVFTGKALRQPLLQLFHIFIVCSPILKPPGKFFFNIFECLNDYGIELCAAAAVMISQNPHD